MSLLQFVCDESLFLCITDHGAEMDFTHESMVNGSRSVIDHFLLSQNLSTSVVKYWANHAVDNFSDHDLNESDFNGKLKSTPSLF